MKNSYRFALLLAAPVFLPLVEWGGWAVRHRPRAATVLVPMSWTVIADKRIQGLSGPFAADLVAQMEDLWIED